MTKAKDVTAAVQEIIGLDYSQFCQIAMIAQGQFTKLLNASTEERSRIFRKLFRTQRYARLQERLQAESAALSQQRTTQNAKLDSLLSGIRFSPDFINNKTVFTTFVAKIEAQYRFFRYRKNL